MRTLLWMAATPTLVLSLAFWGCARPIPEPTGAEADSATGDERAAATEVEEESAADAPIRSGEVANDGADHAADNSKVLRAVGSSLMSVFGADRSPEPDEAPQFHSDRP